MRKRYIVLWLVIAVIFVPKVSAAMPDFTFLTRRTLQIIAALGKMTTDRKAMTVHLRTASPRPVLRAAAPAIRAVSRSTLAPTIGSRRGGGGGGGANRTDGGTSSAQRDSQALIEPSITFDDIAKTYGDADFSLSPASDSSGAFTYVSGNLAVATVSSSTVTITGAGSITITATQAANGNYIGGSATATLTVAKASSILTLTSNNNPSQYSENVRLTAAVTSGATGTVTFSSGSTTLGTGTISNGSGSLNITTLVRGTGSLLAVYGGDANFNGSTSTTLTQRVYKNQCLPAGFCQHGGTCTNIGDGYSCACVAPYSGARCELSDAFCNASHGGTDCKNSGTCVPGSSGGTCSCTACYSGDFCDFFNPDECA